MLREGALVGVIVIRRTEVRPFTDKQIELVATFADQAVIAIENARLFQELQARTRELTRSVEELQALGEVSQAVSSTLDLQTVLTTIVSRAVQLCGRRRRGRSTSTTRAPQEFQLRASHRHARGAGRGAARRADPRSGKGAIGPGGAPPRAGPGARHRRRAAYSASRIRTVLLGYGIPRAPGGAAAARGARPRRPGRVAAGRGRVPGRGRRPAPDLRQPVGAGHRERPALPGARGEEPRARGREPAQVAVPGQHVPRAADAAERHHRLLRDAPGGGRGPRQAEAFVPDLQRINAAGQAPARADQRHPRPLEDRGRADGPLPGDVRGRAARAGRRGRRPAARREERQPPGGRVRCPTSARCTPT